MVAIAIKPFLTYGIHHLFMTDQEWLQCIAIKPFLTYGRHHLFVTDQELVAIAINHAFRLLLPFFIFPVVLLGLFLYGLQV